MDQSFRKLAKQSGKPDPYGTDDVEQDIWKLTEFYDSFRAWLFYAEPEYEASPDHLEGNTATPSDLTTLGLPQVQRARQLYSFL